MNCVYYLKLVLLLILFTLATNVQAVVKAEVDRHEVGEGESFQLVVESDGDNPELGALKKDFDVLGTSRNSQVQFVNGRMSSTTQWFITLRPKRLGNLVIPPISIGQDKTPAIAVKVSAIKQGGTTSNADEAFVEAVLSKKSLWVQEQTILTIRLFSSQNIAKGSLTQPQVDKLLVERLGDDVSYSTRRNGRQYQVTERRYALFPQQSGELRLPPIVFEGEVIERGRRFGGGFDPFFNNRSRVIKRQSQALNLSVKPQDANYGTDWWLPSGKVTLSQQFDKSLDGVKVGEAVTWNLRLEAEGLSASQLPEIAIAEVEGLSFYQDKASTDQRVDKDGINAQRLEKVAVIPSKSGTLKLPEIQVKWWDTKANKVRYAKLRSEAITVLAGPSVPNSLSLPESSLGDTVSQDKDESTLETQSSMLVYLFAALWLLTLLGWFAENRLRLRAVRKSPAQGDAQKGKNSSVSLVSLEKQLQVACNANDPSKGRELLLAWGKTYFADRRINTLDDLKRHLKHSDFLQAIDQLNHILYAKAPLDWDGYGLWNAFIEAKTVATKAEKQNKERQSLPKLYPF